MSTIEVNKITPVSGGTAIQVGESGDTITVPSGATITNSGTANNFTSYRPNAQALIINGSMDVAQRSANATGLTSSGYKSIDRFYTTLYYTSSNVGTFTQSQSTDVPTGYGFRNSLKMNCTTAQGSLPASGQIAIRHTIEAQNMNPFKFGTSNAEKMTLAFWVKSNLTGTYNVSMYHQDGSSTPQVNSQYSISSANTWEKKVLVIPADTSNAFNDDNGQGLSIDWIMGTGSTYTGGTAPTTWSAFVNNTFNGGSTVNMASSTSNEWLITGIQLEVGEYTSATIPPFQFETFANNLLRCQRYYNIFGNNTGKPMGMAAFYTSTSAYVGPLVYPVEMRSTPTITITGGSGDAEATAGYALNHSAQNDWFQTFSSSASSTKECQLYVSSGISGGDGDAGRCKIGDSEANKGKIEASAEL